MSDPSWSRANTGRLQRSTSTSLLPRIAWHQMPGNPEKKNHLFLCETSIVHRQEQPARILCCQARSCHIRPTSKNQGDIQTLTKILSTTTTDSLIRKFITTDIRFRHLHRPRIRLELREEPSSGDLRLSPLLSA